MTWIVNLLTGATSFLSSYTWVIIGVLAAGILGFVGYQYLEIDKLEAERDKAVQAEQIAELTLTEKTKEYKLSIEAVNKDYNDTVARLKQDQEDKEGINDAAKKDANDCGVQPSLQWELDRLRSRGKQHTSVSKTGNPRTTTKLSGRANSGK